MLASGIWSNIFSLNLLDAWYDLPSSADTWKQHFKDKIRNLGRKRKQRAEPGLRPLPLQMLWWGRGGLSEGGMARRFQAPHWTNVCFSGPRGAPCLLEDFLMVRGLVAAAWNSPGPGI